MKYNILFANLLLIIKSISAQNNALSDIISSKSHYDSIASECKIVNQLLNKDESFDCCNLLGVVECENKHITKLHIEERGICSEIPVGIGKLIYLRELWLDHNNFYGTIPSQIGDIVYLQDLSLGANSLSGPIPPEIGQLTDLHTLRLYDNKLSHSIPEEIGKLTNLIHLDLKNNTLSGNIPYGIGNLSKLQDLNLEGNNLEGEIPFAFGKLASLEQLKMCNNSLTGTIPEVLGRLTNLTELDVEGNSLDVKTVPVELKKVKDFRYGNQHEKKSQSSSLIITFVIIGVFVILVLIAFCFFKKRTDKKENWKSLPKKQENNEIKSPGNDSIIIENNHIAVTMNKPNISEQPEKSQSDINTSQLKKQIEEQEQQLQQQLQQQKLQLQEIQNMKNQLNQFEKPSSSSIEVNSYPKTKEQEVLAERQNISYGHSTIPVNASMASGSSINPNISFNPTAPMILEDNPPDYNEVIKNIQ